MKKGFNILEILIAVAIVLGVGAVSLSSFIEWRSAKKVETASDIVLSVLNEARNLTVNAYGGNQYGVYLGINDRVVRFTGVVYSSEDASNTITLLPSGVVISTSTLGTSIVFQKFSGGIGKSGHIIVEDISNASSTRIVNIDSAGALSTK